MKQFDRECGSHGSRIAVRKKMIGNKQIRPGLGTWIAWIVDRNSESKIKIKLRNYTDLF